MLVDHERESVFPQGLDWECKYPLIALKKYVKRLNRGREQSDERFALFCKGRPIYSP